MKDYSAIGYPVTAYGHERQRAQAVEFGRPTVLSTRCHWSSKGIVEVEFGQRVLVVLEFGFVRLGVAERRLPRA
jgi:hypothetical protein